MNTLNKGKMMEWEFKKNEKTTQEQNKERNENERRRVRKKEESKGYDMKVRKEEYAI